MLRWLGAHDERPKDEVITKKGIPDLEKVGESVSDFAAWLLYSSQKVVELAGHSCIRSTEESQARE
jgi:hypothetical protein